VIPHKSAKNAEGSAIESTWCFCSIAACFVAYPDGPGYLFPISAEIRDRRDVVSCCRARARLGIFLPRIILDIEQNRYHTTHSKLSILRLESDGCAEIHFPSIFQLPLLRTLPTDSFSPPGRSWRIDAGVSDMHCLKLTHCGMDKDEMLPLLRACRELRKFKFH
jgi:hypothetical protein